MNDSTHSEHNTSDTRVTENLVQDSAERLFAQAVDKGLRERAEAGELDATLWQRVSDSGLPMLLASETHGGFGQSWAVAYPVLRGLGYWQVPLPLAETMLAQCLASMAGLHVPDGPLTVIEQGCGNDIQLDAGGQTMSGTAYAVPWARHAKVALLSLADGSVTTLALQGAPGLVLQPHNNAAGLPSDTLVLRGAAITAPRAHGLALRQPVWTLGAMVRSAMLVGALESALEHAARYANERVQFGKPIGRNQAIQQNLALVAGDVAAARMAAMVAASDAPDSVSTATTATIATSATHFSAAVAKVRAGEAATRAAGIVHQVHGAIGFTREHALHFATRRLWAWREEFGSDAHWAGELGRAAIAARAVGFWPGITAKHFTAAG